MDSRKCFVNYIFGGGIFVCRRPVATKNGFCEYHGNVSIGEAKFELTWREWFKYHFVRKPYNLYRAIRRLPKRIRFWWRTRNLPLCAAPGCFDKVIGVEGPYCVDHLLQEQLDACPLTESNDEYPSYP